MATIWGFDPIAFWIVATGLLVNVSGALLGNYLVLRRLSMLGDAISHAVLPGLAISFLVAQVRSPWAMMLGALAAGLVTVLLTELIRKYAKVAEDAAMGVVFTALFALGVVIISKVASQVDLDPGCVLYGILESAAIDTVPVLGLEVPRITLTLGVTTLAVIVFVAVFWKELKIVSFDPALATTLGINATLVHYLLMAMVAIFTVAAFEAVGSILVVAMLVAPSATAYLLTDRLGRMAAWSVAAGVSAALLGRWSAWHLDTSAAGMMAVIAGVQFALAALFAPRYGYLARRLFQARVALRIAREDWLAMLYRWSELSPERPMPRREAFTAIGGGSMAYLALAQLRLAGTVAAGDAALALTEAGRRHGGGIVQGHRLWETYLAKHFALPADHLHAPAHRVEHFLRPELRRDIAAEVEHPQTDPHGRPIRGEPPD
jgi:manganese/zinc/iron transport system permease protein